MAKDIRVYEYWCEPASLEDGARLNKQLRLARAYRYKLADIENQSRIAQRLLEQRFPTVVALRAATETMGNDLDKAAKDAAFKALSLARREMMRSQDYKDALRELGDKRQLAMRWARGWFASQGLSWGTYQFVEEAHDSSVSNLPFWEDVKVRIPYGHGVIAIHIQGRALMCGSGVEAINDSFVAVGEKLYGLNQRVAGFRSVKEEGAPRNKGGGGAPRLRSLSIRTGSDGRKPLWTNFHMRMHRPLPAGKILWTRIHQTRIGVRTRWHAQFVVELDAVANHFEVPEALKGVIGIDVGWRKHEDNSMRVAMGWSDGATAPNELSIPDLILRRAKKSSDIQSIRDKMRDTQRAVLLAMRETAPAWFVEATTMTHAWFRTGRFVNLHNLWRDNRFEGDERPFTEMQAWIARDRHLTDYGFFNLAKMKRQIDDRYRAWAYEIAKTHAVIAIEDLNLTNLKASSGDYVSDVAHERGMVIGVGLLVNWLKRAATKFRRKLMLVNPAYTSRDCTKCGFRNEAAGADLQTVCEACGFAEDQDIRAAKNIAREGMLLMVRERDGDEPTGPSETKVRVRRTRKKKVETSMVAQSPES